MLPSNHSCIESHLDLRMGTLVPDRKMKSVGIAAYYNISYYSIFPSSVIYIRHFAWPRLVYFNLVFRSKSLRVTLRISHFSVFSFFLRSCNMATDESSAPRAYSMRGYERFWFQNRLSGFRGRSVEAVQKWTREIYVLARCVPSFFCFNFLFFVFRCIQMSGTTSHCACLPNNLQSCHVVALFEYILACGAWGEFLPAAPKLLSSWRCALGPKDWFEWPSRFTMSSSQMFAPLEISC